MRSHRGDMMTGKRGEVARAKGPVWGKSVTRELLAELDKDLRAVYLRFFADGVDHHLFKGESGRQPKRMPNSKE